MATKITISFKNTRREQALIDLINQQEEKSEYIKKAVEYYSRYVEVLDNESNTFNQ